jgi:hypothetical protein
MASTHGVKVSRAGYDVKEASDKQLAFSSEWPLLPIEAEGSYNIAAGSQTYDIYTHSLDYYPVFSVWREVSGKRYHESAQSGTYVTTSKLAYDGWSEDAFTLHWKVYRRPLRLNYTAENISTTDATEKDSGDYGVIVSLPGKDISSTDKRDFGVRSDVRQLMIHKTGYEDSTLTETITHNLGYKPIYWFFIETDWNPNRYYCVAPTDDFVLSASDTQLTFEFFSFTPQNWAYLIFKDPVNLNG